MSQAKPLRERMPWVASMIDAHRAEFGAEATNDAIRRGLAGEPTFHSTENGEEVGTQWVTGLPVERPAP